MNGTGKYWIVGTVVVPAILAVLGIVSRVGDVEKRLLSLEKNLGRLEYKLDRVLEKR